MSLKPLAKTLAAAYYFGVNIVMLINITTTIDKTLAASTYMIL